VRQARAFALLILTASLVGCDGGSPGEGGRPAPSGFVVQPDISDPLCNAGHGVRLRVRLGFNPVVAAAAMPDGSTLISVSGYATNNTVDLYAVAHSCVPRRKFGTAGRATITPSSRAPAYTVDDTLPDALWVNAVTPRKGGAIVAGAY
jgi:hypothetical protein